MGVLKIGTASWTDRSLIQSGKYYPDWCKSAEERLKYYAAEFPVVEVDSTYYGIPSEHNSELWVERTPNAFTFNVKAFRLLTAHPTQPKSLPRDVRDELPPELSEKRNLYYEDVPPALRDRVWEMFESALSPLNSAGKLGAIVFQFPPWFMPRRKSYAHIAECKEYLSKYQIAVEFRNRYWLYEDSLEETLSFLRRNELSFVAVDEPQGFTSSMPPVADVTGRFGMVRFHGRNRETWEKKGLRSASERFDYYYSAAEMAEWLPRVQVMKENASEVHLVMNTNKDDQGIANARLLGSMLGEGLEMDLGQRKTPELDRGNQPSLFDSQGEEP